MGRLSSRMEAAVAAADMWQFSHAVSGAARSLSQMIYDVIDVSLDGDDALIAVFCPDQYEDGEFDASIDWRAAEISSALERA